MAGPHIDAENFVRREQSDGDNRSEADQSTGRCLDEPGSRCLEAWWSRRVWIEDDVTYRTGWSLASAPLSDATVWLGSGNRPIAAPLRGLVFRPYPPFGRPLVGTSF